MQNKISNLLVGLGLFLASSPAQTNLWTPSGAIIVHNWTLKSLPTTDAWPNGDLQSLSDFTNLSPLKLGSNAFSYQIYKSLSTPNSSEWLQFNTDLSILDSNNSWRDSTVLRFSAYQKGSKIAINSSSFLPQDSNRYASLIRIVNLASDTLNNGLTQVDTLSYKINGILTGEAPNQNGSAKLWYVGAVLYTGSNFGILKQIVNGDSAKALNSVSASLAQQTFDSLKVQMIAINYVEQQSTPIVLPQIFNGPFQVDGRNITINLNSDTKQLLNIFNAAGEIIQFWRFDSEHGNKQIQLDPIHFPAGVYFLKLYNSKGSFQTQAILQN